MNNPYLSKIHRNIIEQPFVFISYCWENKRTAKKVVDLVESLRLDNIPVLYDEHGISEGTNIGQLQYNILNNNCKFVFIVCDKSYAKKVNKQIPSGALEEFHYILNDYHRNPLKYVLINAGGEIPLFNGDAYFDFDDKSLFENISKFCRIELDIPDNIGITTKELVENMYNSANRCYDYGEYDVAISKLTTALSKYEKSKEARAFMKLKILHLMLNIYIKKDNSDKAILTAKKIREIMPSNLDVRTKARYLGNCALAYSINDTDLFLAEEYAKKTFDISKNANLMTNYIIHDCMRRFCLKPNNIVWHVN